MPTIYDNIDKHLTEGLTNTLQSSYRADFCIGYFNLRGWKFLVDSIENLEGSYLPKEYDDGIFYQCRVIVGMQKPPKLEIKEQMAGTLNKPVTKAEANKYKQIIAREFSEQFHIGAPTKDDHIALQKLKNQLLSGKVVVKLYLKLPLHAKLYLAHRNDYNSPIIGFVGSSNLTFSGLSKQGELNVDVVDGDAAKKLSNWYEEKWSDPWCVNISQELIDLIEDEWPTSKLIPPYHIYMKIIYHLSQDARTGIAIYDIPSIFDRKLLLFQQYAVKIAAEILNKRGGVVIADVVGLGKTFTATALAKMIEEQQSIETLIICPKNLEEMWEGYVHKFQLRAKIIPVSMADKKLSTTRRYRIVIIDESHNLRNPEGQRYRAIREYITLNESKVILLTATPYNKEYKDLSSQLKLFVQDDYNLGIRPEKFIAHSGGIDYFSALYQLSETSIAAFEKSYFKEDWLNLMRLFMVRRTRSFIKREYAVLDESNGRKYMVFPDGTKSYIPDRIPRKVEYKFDQKNKEDQYARLYDAKVVNIIDNLILPRYGLKQDKYINGKKLENIDTNSKHIMENLGRAGTRLIGFARTNLFKRLESSGYSFLLSVERHVLRNFLYLYIIENKLEFPIGLQETGVNTLFDDESMDNDVSDSNDKNINPGQKQKLKFKILKSEEEFEKEAEKYYKSILKNNKKSYKWLDSKFFRKQLEKDLYDDSMELIKILEYGQFWSQENDRKLNALHKLITETHQNDKILVFTQFSDTANYIYKSLKYRNIKEMELVTGDTDDPTNLAYRFSPKSNKENIVKGYDQIMAKELRVLITTDVLSEGQNLQDSHIIVNYDLPWAIIRLIQRAGRVDRIGQEHHEILCYSFLPEEGIENIINLRNRLKNRIKQNAESVGSDEVFFEGDPINIEDLYNEKAGIYDESEDDAEIDFTSQAYQIWKNAIKADPGLEKIITNMKDVVFTSKAAGDNWDANSSILFARTHSGIDEMIWLAEGDKVISQSPQAILLAAKCSPQEEALETADYHYELVREGLKKIDDNVKKVGGQLGSKKGIKFRVYDRLIKYIQKYEDSLFQDQELKDAVQELYVYPMREYAKDVLNRDLTSGVDDKLLAEKVIALKTDGKLVIKNDDETEDREPKIICSMGLRV